MMLMLSYSAMKMYTFRTILLHRFEKSPAHLRAALPVSVSTLPVNFHIGSTVTGQDQVYPVRLNEMVIVIRAVYSMEALSAATSAFSASICSC